MKKVWAIGSSPEQIIDSEDEDNKHDHQFDYNKDALNVILNLLTGDQKETIDMFFIPKLSLDFKLMLA